MNIGKRIKDLMALKGINANGLSAQADVTPSTIYSIIRRDGSRIDIDLLIKIAHALNMTVDELLEAHSGRNESSDPSFDAQLVRAYHSASEEARSIVRYTLKLSEELV